jgi:UDP:flavonoid glycosyltransferase YjiC (YdhE family)
MALMSHPSLSNPLVPEQARVTSILRRPAPRRRPRVLLAWEHGRNYGRLSRLLQVARMVEQQGGEPVWVVPRSQRDAPALVSLSHRRLVAPAIEQQVFAPDFRADSFADVLWSVGFDKPEALLIATHAWAQIIELLQPECVVLDYAPAAQLTAQLLGLRAFQLTNGFDAPPSHCPPYARVRVDSALSQRNATRVAQVSAHIEQVGLQHAGRYSSSLQAILAHPSKIYECVPEADPYGPRDDGLCVGPLGTQHDTVDVAWPDSAQHHRRVFAHLRTTAGASELLDELLLSDAVTLCVWRDAPDEVMARYRNTGVRIVRQPVRLERVLAEADAVVNQGATTLVNQTLLAGKPQLIMPTDFEKLKVAQRVAESGAGALWHPAECGAHEAVRRLLHTPQHAEIARAVAARYPREWLDANANRFARSLMGVIEIGPEPLFADAPDRAVGT